MSSNSITDYTNRQTYDRTQSKLGWVRFNVLHGTSSESFPFPTNHLTGIKHSLYPTNKLTDSDKAQQNYDQEQRKSLSNITRQESLANAKVSTRQQCM